MTSEDAFAYFIESLETLENLLHAETQAIAAKDLDTIDSIMVQKDESLKVLLYENGHQLKKKEES
jgi:flagellar biosynthesis/type III secretory pathway chaperone